MTRYLFLVVMLFGCARTAPLLIEPGVYVVDGVLDSDECNFNNVNNKKFRAIWDISFDEGDDQWTIANALGGYTIKGIQDEDKLVFVDDELVDGGICKQEGVIMAIVLGPADGSFIGYIDDNYIRRECEPEYADFEVDCHRIWLILGERYWPGTQELL